MFNFGSFAQYILTQVHSPKERTFVLYRSSKQEVKGIHWIGEVIITRIQVTLCPRLSVILKQYQGPQLFTKQAVQIPIK